MSPCSMSVRENEPIPNSSRSLTGLTLQLSDGLHDIAFQDRRVPRGLGERGRGDVLGYAFIRSAYSSPERSGHDELNPS